MGDVIEELNYTRKNGGKQDYDLTVFTLSTCGFCKRALAFLESHGFAYRFIHLDTIAPETKRQVKETLRERFNITPIFPILVVDGKRALTGFTEPQWRKVLKTPETTSTT